MKNLLKIVFLLSVIFSNFAYGQTKVLEDMKQAGMQSLVEVSKTMYNESPETFILNIQKHDNTTLTSYEKSLMLEVHNNIKDNRTFGQYETIILSDFQSYDRVEDCTSDTAAKGKGKVIIQIIKVVIRVLIELCDWLC